jgi:hypothetical protein
MSSRRSFSEILAPRAEEDAGQGSIGMLVVALTPEISSEWSWLLSS